MIGLSTHLLNDIFHLLKAAKCHHPVDSTEEKKKNSSTKSYHFIIDYDEWLRNNNQAKDILSERESLAKCFYLSKMVKGSVFSYPSLVVGNLITR